MRQMTTPFGYEHVENTECASRGCTPVQSEPTPSIDGEMFVPNPVVREYRQLRHALHRLFDAIVIEDYTFDGTDEDNEFLEAYGFAQATLALVQPVDPSELD